MRNGRRWREIVCGEKRREEGEKTRVEGRQGLSPPVPPVLVVVSATVMAAPVAAVVPMVRVLVVMPLLVVDLLIVSACVALASRAIPIASVVAAATSSAAREAWLGPDCCRCC